MRAQDKPPGPPDVCEAIINVCTLCGVPDNIILLYLHTPIIYNVIGFWHSGLPFYRVIENSAKIYEKKKKGKFVGAFTSVYRFFFFL